MFGLLNCSATTLQFTHMNRDDVMTQQCLVCGTHGPYAQKRKGDVDDITARSHLL